jgi:putative transposase
MMILNYTYRLYPDAHQVELLNEWLETCRVSYNYALRELKDWIASRKCSVDRCSLKSEYIMAADYPFPSYHQQQNNLPRAKKKFPRLKSVPSQVLQTNVKRLHDSWDSFRARGFGFSRFKKYGQLKSILFPQFKTNPLSDWQIQIPKLGKVQINLQRSIPDGFVVKQVRVVKKVVGWFAVLATQSDFDFPNPVPHGHAIGVDVGLLSYMATSDGFIESRPKFFKTAYRRLKVLQKRLSKKRRAPLKGSTVPTTRGTRATDCLTASPLGAKERSPMKRGENHEKARIKVAKQHNHIAFKRKDYQFKLAHKLCDMGDTIFVEDCDFRIMAKGMLGKHTIYASFGQLRSILEYVATKRNVFVGRVDHRGTSQTCPNCRSTVRKDLSVRLHECHECGYIVDRDIASAQEICNRGEERSRFLWEASHRKRDLTYRRTREKQEIGFSSRTVGQPSCR